MSGAASFDIDMRDPSIKSLSVKHSGGVGDIIYSIPALLSVAKTRRAEHVIYYLQLNQPQEYSTWHPLGNLLLDLSYANKLRPLLLSQSCIQSVEEYSGQPVDVDFDAFRQVPLNATMYS